MRRGRGCRFRKGRGRRRPELAPLPGRGSGVRHAAISLIQRNGDLSLDGSYLPQESALQSKCYVMLRAMSSPSDFSKARESWDRGSEGDRLKPLRGVVTRAVGLARAQEGIDT
jgi:hypothetical protein